MDIEAIKKRKGAVKTSLIPQEVKELLNAGLIESVNLNEILVIDNLLLFENICRGAGLNTDTNTLRAELNGEKIMAVSKRLGNEIYCMMKNGAMTAEQFRTLSSHTSDTVRNWCAMSVGFHGISLNEKLDMIRKFADDSHMGVREMAWMSVRDDISQEIENAITILAEWTKDKSGNIRRFASEATRPRGVWCRHINILKIEPEKGLAILEPLKADQEQYVQDSVANWLNDASKTKPEWVIDTTQRWLAESKCKETERICKRAVRSIK